MLFITGHYGTQPVRDERRFVSKETVVLRRWECITGQFIFIK